MTAADAPTERRHLRVLPEPPAERPMQLTFAALSAVDRGAEAEPAADRDVAERLDAMRGRLRRAGGLG